MSRNNNIGLPSIESETLAEHLNILLANYSVFYQNVRGFHWNIKGQSFFELHLKFEELYNDLFMKIDEVAERILTLGHTPFHTFTKYYQLSIVQETIEVNDGNVAVAFILSSLKAILEKEREILLLTVKINDEGTNALMSDYIRQQEKLVWMYSAYIGQ